MPFLHQFNRWSRQRSTVEVPMFSCIRQNAQIIEERFRVLRSPVCLVSSEVKDKRPINVLTILHSLSTKGITVMINDFFTNHLRYEEEV